MRPASTDCRKAQRTPVGAVDCATSIVGLFRQERTMTLSAKLRLGMVLVLWVPLAAAQSNLGELLDGGAKKLSVEEFKQEVVQHELVGPTASGGNLEVMYAPTGAIAGRGSNVYTPALVTIDGEWTTDDNGRVCTSMRIGGGDFKPGVMLPPRCQFWFKYKQQYFLSDSDSDRSARVLRRTVKE